MRKLVLLTVPLLISACMSIDRAANGGGVSGALNPCGDGHWVQTSQGPRHVSGCREEPTAEAQK